MIGFNEACNWFFNGTWQQCCLDHDKAYELGSDKLLGDWDLFVCVADSSPNPLVAGVGVLMFIAVSVFGGFWYSKAKRDRENKKGK